MEATRYTAPKVEEYQSDYVKMDVKEKDVSMIVRDINVNKPSGIPFINNRILKALN